MNKPNISVRQGLAQRHRRSVLAAAVLIILSVVLACLVMTCGNTYYSLAEVWKILTSEGTKGAAFTIKTLRLPKMLIGILAGIAFGCPETHFKPCFGIHWQVRILLVLQVEPVQQQCFVF